jgi:hypothetical protein
MAVRPLARLQNLSAVKLLLKPGLCLLDFGQVAGPPDVLFDSLFDVLLGAPSHDPVVLPPDVPHDVPGYRAE